MIIAATGPYEKYVAILSLERTLATFKGILQLSRRKPRNAGCGCHLEGFQFVPLISNT